MFLNWLLCRLIFKVEDFKDEKISSILSYPWLAGPGPGGWAEDSRYGLVLESSPGLTSGWRHQPQLSRGQRGPGPMANTPARPWTPGTASQTSSTTLWGGKQGRDKGSLIGFMSRIWWVGEVQESWVSDWHDNTLRRMPVVKSEHEWMGGEWWVSGGPPACSPQGWEGGGIKYRLKTLCPSGQIEKRWEDNTPRYQVTNW